ncbi:hypothetical protein [Bacillus infantis]|uniref:hypothetical protein n=1 Tax=Bacillus infantis TaxID=324767 RepID=UPI003CF9EA75
MYIVGKSLIDNKVFVSPRHRKFELMFSFASEEEADKYYRSLDYENEKFLKPRIKAFFCKHEKEYDLDLGSKLYHYKCCTNCNRAIYVNDETPEAREKRMNTFRATIKEQEIAELENEITYKQEKLQKLKREFTMLKQGE